MSARHRAILAAPAQAGRRRVTADDIVILGAAFGVVLAYGLWLAFRLTGAL